MELFDDFYRPDTSSQRWRLALASLPPLVLALLPALPPFMQWLASTNMIRFGSRVVATLLSLVGHASPYPGPLWLARALLVLLASVLLLRGVRLQVQVLRQFAPHSQTLRLAQRILVLYVLLGLSLVWGGYQLWHWN